MVGLVLVAAEDAGARRGGADRVVGDAAECAADGQGAGGMRFDTLSKLCLVLECVPGDSLAYERDDRDLDVEVAWLVVRWRCHGLAL